MSLKARKIELSWEKEKVGGATSVRIVYQLIEFHKEFPRRCEEKSVIKGACVSGPYKDCKDQTEYQEGYKNKS